MVVNSASTISRSPRSMMRQLFHHYPHLSIGMNVGKYPRDVLRQEPSGRFVRHRARATLPVLVEPKTRDLLATGVANCERCFMPAYLEREAIVIEAADHSCRSRLAPSPFVEIDSAYIAF